MRWILIVCLALTLPACGGGKSEPSPEATESYLARKGQVMPLRSALQGIAFRPFIPARQIVETALIPAYNGGDDTKANRGIGFEYVSNHGSYVFSQWPGKGQQGPHDLGNEHGCALSAYNIAGGTTGHQGVLWSNGTIMSDLVPTGNVSDKATFAEARRLVRLGACR